MSVTLLVMIDNGKVNAVKELFDGRMKFKSTGGDGGSGDIQNRKGKERLSHWRIGLFKSLSFLYIYHSLCFSNFLMMVVEFL